MLNKEKLREWKFWGVVRITSGCWEWTGPLTKDGYGRSGSNLAHRVVFDFTGMQIPESLYVDHKCRNRKCVNPNHLRFVTPRISSLENCTSPPARNKKKKFCDRGHKYTKENTRNRNGNRACGECLKIKWREWYYSNYEENKKKETERMRKYRARKNEARENLD